MFFERGEAPLIARIERRIAALLRWPADHGEGLQILRYRPGAQYRPHHDYFDPAQPGTATVLERGGQRVATLVMYLNAPERGGATTFPDVGLEVAPVKGCAVFFSYDRPQSRPAPCMAARRCWRARSGWRRSGCASAYSSEAQASTLSPCCGTRTASPARARCACAARRRRRARRARRRSARGGRRQPRSQSSSSSPSAWPEKPCRWLHLGAHRHVLAVDLDLASRRPPGARRGCRRPGSRGTRWCGAVRRHRLQVVQHAPAGGHAAGRDDDARVARARQPHRLLRRRRPCARRRAARHLARADAQQLRCRRYSAVASRAIGLSRKIGSSRGIAPAARSRCSTQQQRLRAADGERRQQHRAAALHRVAHDTGQRAPASSSRGACGCRRSTRRSARRRRAAAAAASAGRPRGRGRRRRRAVRCRDSSAPRRRRAGGPPA